MEMNLSSDNFDAGELLGADPSIEESAAAEDITETVEEVSDVEEAPEAEETPAEDEQPEVEAPPVEEPPVEAKDPTVPEDVTVKEGRNGKKVWVYDESRGRQIYGAYKQAEAAREVFGEDLTPEAVQMRQDAYEAQNGMYLDFISGDPRQQKNIFSHFMRQAARAQEAGEIGFDPVPAAAEAFVAALEERSPRTLDSLRQRFAVPEESVQERVLRNVYDAAMRAGNKDLKNAAAHIAMHLRGLPPDAVFNWLGQAEKPVDPQAAREQELATREQAIRERDTRDRQAQLQAWNRSASEGVNQSVAQSIDESLDSVKANYEKFPEDFKNLKIRFEREVKDAIQADPKWRQANEDLYRRASLAASEQIRADLKQQIISRYTAKAKAVLDRVRPKILSEQATRLKADSEAKRARSEAARERKGPNGVSAPVSRSLPAKGSNGPLSREAWGQALDSMFDN